MCSHLLHLPRPRQEDEGTKRCVGTRCVRTVVGAWFPGALVGRPAGGPGAEITGQRRDSLAGLTAHMVEESPIYPRPVGGRRTEWCPAHLERVQHRRHLHRGHPASGAAGQQVRPPLGVQSGRHGDESQVVAQLGELTEHGDQEVGVEVTLVDLVEDDGVNPAKFGIGEQPAHQHPGGDELDSGRGTEGGLATHGVGSHLPRPGAGELAQTPCRGPSRHPSRLGDDHPTGTPIVRMGTVRTDITRSIRGGEGGDQGRHEGRLAGAGWGLDDHRPTCQTSFQIGAVLTDRQSGADVLQVDGP